MTEQIYKRYVDVVLFQKKSGEIRPLYILWENGEKYRIDRIMGIGRKASKAGGCGLRYECMIHGKRRNLFYEKDKWFLESFQP